MKELREKPHLRRSVGVFRREEHFQLKCPCRPAVSNDAGFNCRSVGAGLCLQRMAPTAFPGSVFGPEDDGSPLHDVVCQRSAADAMRRVSLQFSEVSDEALALRETTRKQKRLERLSLGSSAIDSSKRRGARRRSTPGIEKGRRKDRRASWPIHHGVCTADGAPCERRAPAKGSSVFSGAQREEQKDAQSRQCLTA